MTIRVVINPSCRGRETFAHFTIKSLHSRTFFERSRKVVSIDSRRQSMEMNAGTRPPLSTRGPVRVAGLLHPRRPMRPPTGSKLNTNLGEEEGKTGLHSRRDGTVTCQEDATHTNGDMGSRSQFGQPAPVSQTADMSQCSNRSSDSVPIQQTSVSRSVMHHYKDQSVGMLENSAGRRQAILKEQERRRGGSMKIAESSDAVPASTYSAAGSTNGSNSGSGSVKQEPVISLQPDQRKSCSPCRISPVPSQCQERDPDIHPGDSAANNLQQHKRRVFTPSARLRSRSLSTSRNRNFSSDREEMEEFAKCVKAVPSAKERERNSFREVCSAGVKDSFGNVLPVRENVCRSGKISPLCQERKDSLRDTCTDRPVERENGLGAKPGVESLGSVSPNSSGSFREIAAAQEEGRKSHWDLLITSRNMDRPRTDRSNMDRSGTDRSSMDRSRTDRSSMDGSRTDRSSMDSSRTDRSNMDSSRTASRSSMDRSSMERSRTDRSIMDGSRTDRSSMDGSRTDRSSMDSSRTDRSSMDMSRTDRSSMERSRTDRSSMDRSSMDRSRTDRSSMDRSRTDRSSMDRSRTDRSSVDRSWTDESRLEMSRMLSSVSSGKVECFREMPPSKGEGRESFEETLPVGEEASGLGVVSPPGRSRKDIHKRMSSAKARAEKLERYQICLGTGNGFGENGAPKDRPQRGGDKAQTSSLELDNESNISTISTKDSSQVSLSSSDTSLRDDTASEKNCVEVCDKPVNYLKLEVPGQAGRPGYTLTLITADMSNLMDSFSVLGSAKGANVVSSGLDSDALVEEIAFQTGLPVTIEKRHDLPKDGRYSPQAMLEMSRSPLSQQTPRGWDSITKRFQSFDIGYVLHQWGRTKYFEPSDHSISLDRCGSIFRIRALTRANANEDWDEVDKRRTFFGKEGSEEGSGTDKEYATSANRGESSSTA